MSDQLDFLRPVEAPEPDESPASEEMTLSEARAFVAERIDKGVCCPTCDGYRKRYRRGFNSSMAAAVIAIADATSDGRFVHVGELLNRRFPPRIAAALRGDWSKAFFFGVIEPKPDDGETRNGMWRITAHGRAFVEGRVKVPRYVWIYDGVPQTTSEEQVSIEEALGDRFSFEDLMRSNPMPEAANG